MLVWECREVYIMTDTITQSKLYSLWSPAINSTNTYYPVSTLATLCPFNASLLWSKCYHGDHILISDRHYFPFFFFFIKRFVQERHFRKKEASRKKFRATISFSLGLLVAYSVSSLSGIELHFPLHSFLPSLSGLLPPKSLSKVCSQTWSK